MQEQLNDILKHLQRLRPFKSEPVETRFTTWMENQTSRLRWLCSFAFLLLCLIAAVVQLGNLRAPALGEVAMYIGIAQYLGGRPSSGC
jgi:hypothetical protein